jgi:hypothetical protein
MPLRRSKQRKKPKKSLKPLFCKQLFALIAVILRFIGMFGLFLTKM